MKLKIINNIKNNINIDTRANLHSRAPLSPIGVYNLRVSDIRSRNIFFVALCRSFGIPSRLNPQTIEPEYYENSKWIPVFFETEVPEKNIYSKGFVQLVNKSLGLKPKYYLNFTLGKFQRGVYKTLEFEENRLIDDFPEKLELDTGKYLLVTGNRLNNGSVLSRLTFFDVKKDEKTKVEVTIREQAEKPKPWGKINPAKYVFINHGENLEYKFDESIKLSGAILIYIDPDKEPTKHVMKDIPEFKDVFEKWGGPKIGRAHV